MPRRESRLRSRGRGLFRQEWYSICSRHGRYNESCDNCTTGLWINVWRQRLGHEVYKRYPNLWRAWANRRWFNGDKRWLESVFPGLKRKK